MRVEEMALRSEIRQMLNEAGFNKNTLKDLVKQVLRDEVEKAVKQAINETNFVGYIKQEANGIIRNATKSYLTDTITRQVVGDWFNRLKVSVDVTDKVGKSILNSESEDCTDCILDKIAAEIEEIETYDGIYIDRAYVLEIIDNYKAESDE